MLYPFLSTLSTSDYQYKSRSRHLQKYSDDSAVGECISDGQEEEEYGALADDFMFWSGRNHRLINVNKTKEMVIEVRRKRMARWPVSILGHSLSCVGEEVTEQTVIHLLDGQQITFSKRLGAAKTEMGNLLYRMLSPSVIQYIL